MLRWLFLMALSVGLAIPPALALGSLANLFSADAGLFTGLFVFVSLVGVLMTKTEDKV